MSLYNTAAEGNLHTFHTPRTPMTRSGAGATGGAPWGGEALKYWEWAQAASKLGDHLHSQ